MTDNKKTTNDITTQDATTISSCNLAKEFSFSSLEAVRKKLLDLSARNAFLNYRHPKTKCVRLVAKFPDYLVKNLQDHKSLTFTPIPEPTELELINAGYIEVDIYTKEKKTLGYPTAKQWAEHLNIPTTYDLPKENISGLKEDKYQDTDLQTLMYAPQLESGLRNLKSIAKTTIEESGSNTLYLALGFLEWYESRESETIRLSPLYTLPVCLEKSGIDRSEGVYRYSITIKDDMLLSNIILQEKLANDFDLILPTIEEDVSPEEYFELLQKTILRQQPRWKIRRYASLTILDFSKLVMYQDLDPSNWPEHSSIENHPIIQQFFNSTGIEVDTSTLSYASEHSIDHVDEIHDQFPLVYDADSSQHSALIDAVKGENIVIEGPPGSGKSQTITNLIAACIGNGQKVLFVAEKMAALSVVKQRLDQAGLGDFCLELHSHKTNKLQILQDLNLRLNKQNEYRPPSSIDVDIARLEDLKYKLQHYVELINSQWRQTGLTLHEILNKATRYREQLGLDPQSLSIEGINGEIFTPVKQKELVDNADMLGDIFKQVSEQALGSNISNHYWYGVNNTSLMGYQEKSLNHYLHAWTNNLEILSAYWHRQINELELDIDANTKLDIIQEVFHALIELPDLHGGELLKELPEIAKKQTQFECFLTDYEYIHQNIDSLTIVFKSGIIDSKESADVLTEALQEINQLGLLNNCNLVDLANDLDEIQSTINMAQKINDQFKQIATNVPPMLQGIFTVSTQGLAEFTTLVNFIELLPVELWRYRSSIYGVEELDVLLNQLSERLSVLTPLHKQLIDKFSLHRLPCASQLSHFREALKNKNIFRYFSSDWRTARKKLLSLSATSKPNKKELIDLLPNLIKYSEGVAAINTLNQDTPLLGELYKGVETPIERIISLHKWYKTVRQEYGNGFGERSVLGSILLKLDSNLATAILDTAQNGLAADVNALTKLISDVQKKYTGCQQLIDPKMDFSIQESPLIQLRVKLDRLLKKLTANIHNNSKTLCELDNATKSLYDIQKKISHWQQSEITQWLVPSKLELSVDEDKFSPQILDSCKKTLIIAQKITFVPALLHSIANNPTQKYYQSLKASLPELKLLFENANETVMPFVEQGNIALNEWLDSSQGKINSLIEKNQKALENPNWLNTWIEYIRLKNKLSSQGLSNIISKLESNDINSENLNNVLQLVIHHQLANEILAQHESLALFNGMEQMAIRQKYQDYDRNLLELQRQKIAFKASRNEPLVGIVSGKVANYTETSLIKHEAGKKTKHIAVRNLLQRAGKSIQALKPCFMMSPMSVAQYLKPGQFKFDIVVMDEASQIRPEDALGAIARGTSFVVVGDPKQLPPTVFFKKTINVDDEADIVALEESESILESVIPMFKNRRLRWHYRSRHESLIAFSNKQFYDSNLILFPSPFQESEEFGINFTSVNGRFVNRRNVEEAKEVVKATAMHLLKNPHESIGIVAMNSEQRDEVERQFEQLIKDAPQLLKAYERNSTSDNPLFIKNLENVQGDERDIIVISMTYGPETVGGRTMQRFGPINSNMGWRRLNVLFTRSKKRMHIFSTIGSSDIITSESSSRGVLSLKAFLEYCERGHLHYTQHTGKVADSDFEISVMRALSEYGYECEPQLGVAGYFLDLAVKDPGKPGCFLMGIECDGATYHSAKSTRDRDRLRQDILESLGWKIRRIWSTDWFKNPQAQLYPILQELEKLKLPTANQQIKLQEYDETISALVNIRSVTLNNDVTESSFIHTLAEDGGIDVSSIQYEILNKSNLKDRLELFDRKVIRHELPNTSDSERLLRPAMIEAILYHLPCSKSEFLECIPPYLRKGTAIEEARKYLDPVLNLVADYS